MKQQELCFGESPKDTEWLTQQILKGKLGRGPVDKTSHSTLVVLLGEGPGAGRDLGLQGFPSAAGNHRAGSKRISLRSPLISLDIPIL